MAVDPEKITVRLRRLEESVGLLRTIRKRGKKALLSDPLLRSAANHELHIAAQVCLNVASHLVGQERLGEPSSYGHALELAARHLKLPARFVDSFRGIAGMRNLLVHDYTEVDHEKVFAYLAELGDFAKFSKAVIARYPDARP